MANEYYNLLTAQGPRESLERLRDELAVPDGHEPLAAHVGVPVRGTSEQRREAWGTRGTLHFGEPVIVGRELEWRFDTANAPAWLWVQRLGQQWTDLKLKLFIGCMLEGTGGVVAVENGEVTQNERICSGFGPFFARNGRPGFFVPYWEDEDGYELSLERADLDELLLEDVGAFRDAAQEALDSLGPAELINPDPGAEAPTRDSLA